MDSTRPHYAWFGITGKDTLDLQQLGGGRGPPVGPGYATVQLEQGCWPSSQLTIRWTLGWRARWNAAPSRRQPRTGRRRSGRTPSRCGRDLAQCIHPHAVCPRAPGASGHIADTFESAITWDRFEAFHDAVKAATERAILDATGRPGQVTCRFTHAYPDGPAPYFSFHALGRHGALIEQRQAIKSEAGDALIAAGGTITHHHAVGRDHRPWYDRQRPDLFAAALRAAKRELDPQGMLNPGVLIDP